MVILRCLRPDKVCNQYTLPLHCWNVMFTRQLCMDGNCSLRNFFVCCIWKEYPFLSLASMCVALGYCRRAKKARERASVKWREERRVSSQRPRCFLQLFSSRLPYFHRARDSLESSVISIPGKMHRRKALCLRTFPRVIGI